MVWTDEHARVPGFLVADSRAPVSAHVHESPDPVVSPTHEKDRFLGEIEAEPVPLVGDAALVADAEPVTEMDPIDIAPEDLGIRIELLEERRPLGLTLDQRSDSVHIPDHTACRMSGGSTPRDRRAILASIRRFCDDSVPGRIQR